MTLMSIFSLFWENVCQFVECRSDRCLRWFPPRSHGDPQLLQLGRWQGGLQGDDFHPTPHLSSRCASVCCRTWGDRDEHPRFPKRNQLRGGVGQGRSHPPWDLPPLHFHGVEPRVGRTQHSYGRWARTPRPRPPLLGLRL